MPCRKGLARPRIVYCERGFHGLTNGALSVNGNAEFRDRFGPLLPGCDPVPFGDIEALKRELAARDVAAFIVEPVQGKGVFVAPDGYLAGAQRACRESGTLLVVDEVQTGLGRTGRFLALEHWDLEPDLICLSKALSGGLVPIGAVLVSRRAFDAVFDGMERAVRHGSTFGGNDLAADVSYGRLVSPFWSAPAGVRVESRLAEPGRRRTRALLALGFEGLAPGFFTLEPAVYVSPRGEISGQVSSTFDLLFTQRLILQPRVEVNAAVQKVPEFQIGAGVNDVEVGGRLRYEFRRDLAPYVGVVWTRRTGGTAVMARQAGESVGDFGLVAGVRVWR